jgi:hypothetical protein
MMIAMLGMDNVDGYFERKTYKDRIRVRKEWGRNQCYGVPG